MEWSPRARSRSSSLSVQNPPFQIFSKIRGDIHKSRCTTGINDSVVDTSGEFAAGVNDTCRKFAAGVNDTGGKLPLVWQTMGTISGCRYFKVNLKAKVYIYVNSTIQRSPNKIIKIFLIEDFFHLPPVSTTSVVNLELRISPRIFEKI